MKITLYHASLCTNEIGEVDAFFKLEGKGLKLVHWWGQNDAIYRGEYMNTLFSRVGVAIRTLPSSHINDAITLIEKEI